MDKVTKAEITKIIKDELNSILKDELNKHVKAAIKSRGGREAINDIIKDALTNFVWFLWSKKNLWKGDIK